MKTAQERKAEFMEEFKALLDKHGAEFDTDDDRKVTVCMYAVNDENNDIEKEFSYFEINGAFYPRVNQGGVKALYDWR